MREEIALLTTITSAPTTFLWETPIRHVISAQCDYIVPGDACLTGAGAHRDELGFWCYVKWPEFVEQRTLKHINNIKYGRLHSQTQKYGRMQSQTQK